jgi:hypothetical protein
MKRERLLGAFVGVVLACCMSVAAQEKGGWRASSSTAQSITGDVMLYDEKILINFSSFPMSRIRSLEPGEVGAVFDADTTVGGTGSLYRLNIPATKKFGHRNTLCGTEDVQWMAAYVGGRVLHLAFFSGEKAPVFTLGAISDSTDLCGTFSYAR